MWPTADESPRGRGRSSRKGLLEDSMEEMDPCLGTAGEEEEEEEGP